MKLKDCTFGRLVCTHDKDGNIELIGMIKGITNNCESADLMTRREASRAIPLVEWAEGRTSGIHNHNIYPYAPEDE